MTDSSNYIPKHSLAECEKFLVNPEYNRLKLKNDSASKALAEEWHREFVAHGLIAERKEWAKPDYRKKFDPRQFTEAELQILAEEPESETSKYFGAGAIYGAATALQKMAQEDGPRYERLRQAAQLRGKIETRPSQPVPEPKPTSQFFKLSDEIADQAGLPRGYETNPDGLATVLKVVLEVKEKQIAAEQLAAKSAEQLARDKAADESAATFGRLLEYNREHAQKQRAQNGTTVEKVEVPIGQ